MHFWTNTWRSLNRYVARMRWTYTFYPSVSCGVGYIMLPTSEGKSEETIKNRSATVKRLFWGIWGSRPTVMTDLRWGHGVLGTLMPPLQPDESRKRVAHANHFFVSSRGSVHCTTFGLDWSTLCMALNTTVNSTGFFTTSSLLGIYLCCAFGTSGTGLQGNPVYMVCIFFASWNVVWTVSVSCRSSEPREIAPWSVLQ